ncbi:MAG: hypothetical protein ABIH11_07325 [Candidatus Altiarchaeota archaeon]
MDARRIGVYAGMLVLASMFIISVYDHPASAELQANNIVDQDASQAVAHDCVDFIDEDGDGKCDMELTCAKHNSGEACGNHPETGAQEPGKTLSPNCGACPKNQANGGTCAGKYV